MLGCPGTAFPIQNADPPPGWVGGWGNWVGKFFETFCMGVGFFGGLGGSKYRPWGGVVGGWAGRPGGPEGPLGPPGVGIKEA